MARADKSALEEARYRAIRAREEDQGTHSNLDDMARKRASRRVQENEEKGYRIDGMPKTVGVEGVKPRVQVPAEPVTEEEEVLRRGLKKYNDDKEAFLREMEAMKEHIRRKKEENARREAEKNGCDVATEDAGKPAADQREAAAQESGDAAPELPAGGNCECGHADRAAGRDDRPAERDAGADAGELTPAVPPEAEAESAHISMLPAQPELLRREYGPEDRHELLQEYLQMGKTYEEIAQEHGCARTSVQRWIAKAAQERGIELPMRSGHRENALTSEQEMDAAKRRIAGESVSDLAQEYGCSVSTMQHALANRGAQTRSNMTGIQEDELRRDAQAGMSHKDLMAKYHIGRPKLRAILSVSDARTAELDHENDQLKERLAAAWRAEADIKRQLQEAQDENGRLRALLDEIAWTAGQA